VEDDEEVMLICDFNVNKIASLTASQCSVKPKMPTCADKLAIMPLIDLNLVSFNCVNAKTKGKVIWESCGAARAASDLQKLSIAAANEECEDSDHSEQEEDDNPDEFMDFPHVDDTAVSEGQEFTTCDSKCNPEETLFTETFGLKGSSFHEHFQRTLKLCKEQLLNKKTLAIKLRFEPINRRDENAILVLACPGNAWEPIGYIPGIKVPKVTLAVRNNEITKMTVISVRYQYIFALSTFKYLATVTISKKGKWIKNRDLYKYNEDI
jgi:hypothetical protein